VRKITGVSTGRSARKTEDAIAKRCYWLSQLTAVPEGGASLLRMVLVGQVLFLVESLEERAA